MTETIQIPLNKLVPWDGNVRKTGVEDGLEELAASIAAHGVLQSLVVRKAQRGKYAVVAGQRRLLALQRLAKVKSLMADYAVPCIVVAKDANATEISLTENAVREAMHPADQFEAFRTLVDGGMSIADVAARFGVSDGIVLKRLKLGRLSPAVLDAYRDGRIDLEQAQAFAITDDRQAQEEVLANLPPWHGNARTIRAALTEGEIPASDKRVRLVTLEAYEQEGGAVRRDLFDPDNAGYVLDADMLNRLVAEKLESAAAELRAEGWKWVEIVPECDYGFLSGFRRRYPGHAPLSGDDQAELERLSAEYDELVDTDDEAEIARLDEIDRRIDELSESGTFWPAETLAIAGVVVTVDWQGDIRIERGLVRPEDDVREKSGDKPKGAAAALSAKLVEDLTAQKTAAIQAVLARDADRALAAVVHAMALGLIYPHASDHSCLQIRASASAPVRSIAAPEGVRGIAEIAILRDRWADRLPEDPAALWDWCLAKSRDDLLGLLAFLAALTADDVQRKADRPDSDRLRHGDAVATALGMDMADWFTPTAENYFSRINRNLILQAVTEAKGCGPAPAWQKMKKAELAALAENQVAGTGWLPEPVRIAVADDDDAAEAEAPAEAAE